MAKPGPLTPYRPKAFPTKSIALTAHAKRRLTAAARRARQSESTIVEYLIRHYGPQVTARDIAADAGTP